jgi:hypothetical protein
LFRNLIHEGILLPRRATTMGDKTDTPEPHVQRHTQEFEDPHYHDDDEVPAPDDSPRRTPPPPTARRKLPPPRRRYEED